MAEIKAPDPTVIPHQVDPVEALTDAVPNGEAAQTARRAPGQRNLTDKERIQRQLAISPCVPSKEDATCRCTKVLHFSVFFDGTGNNRDQEMSKDATERGLSNIAKLFEAHKFDVSSGLIRQYIPGVGTPHPEIGDSGGTLGMAIGKGADARIKKALDLLDEEISKVPAQQKILLVNIVVFGFSRGAAQARAFVRDLTAKCARAAGGYKYRAHPIRVAFAGIFDTVCSAYGNMRSAAFSVDGGHNGWADEMKLPPMVEQSVHMIAAHEARRRFPLDSTRIDAAYPDNTVEIWYPGVHSDIGGGYASGFQGRENTISRFALNQMFDLAFASGVLFSAVADLPGRVQDEFNRDDPTLRESFNAYIDAVTLKAGRMEDVQAAHMLLLHRWLRDRVREGARPRSVQRLETKRDAAKLNRDALIRKRRRMIDEAQAVALDGTTAPQADGAEYDAIVKKLLQAEGEYDDADSALSDLKQEDAKYVRDVAHIVSRAKRGGKLTLRERTIKAAWEDGSALPDPVRNFFDIFAHDSVAHFNYDASRLSDWRTIYFGDLKYKPS